VGVGHRLERREGLRGDDEQGLVCDEIMGRCGEVGRVDIGDEAEREVALCVVAQRVVGHHGPEVGAADADRDDVADRPSRVPGPLTRANTVRERSHLVEDVVHLCDDVDAVHDE
jgi:hypothetical protein